MPDKAWQEEETALWNAVMRPRKRKLTAHSLGDQARKRVLLEIEKQKDKEFASDWAALRRFLSH